MSRRREAADLALALRLSTQEARGISTLSPNTLTLSSSHSGTADSRDMELRPFPTHAHVALEVGPHALAHGEPERGSGSAMDLREVLNPSTVDILTGSSAMETIEQVETTSSERAEALSAIESFAPSHAAIVGVPESSANPFATNSGTNTMPPPIHPHISSPAMPPASRVAGTEKNDSSNSGAGSGFGSGSSRPIFSPTQTSARGDQGVPSVTGLGTTHAPKVPRTYGTRRSASPQKQESHPHSRRRFVLSSSPPVEDAQPSRRPGKPHGDDDLSESEVQEEIETPKLNRTRGSTLEVVLSARPAARSATEPHSPDPLDSLPRGTHREAPSRARAASHAPTTTTTTTSQSSVRPDEVGGRRESTRVRDNREKMAKEKEERRRKRREEKAKKEEEERKKTERREKTRVASMSPAKVSAGVTKPDPQASEVEEVTEEVEGEDDTAKRFQAPRKTPAAQSREREPDSTSTQKGKKKAQTAAKGKKRKVIEIEEEEESEDMISAVPAGPSKKASRSPSAPAEPSRDGEDGKGPSVSPFKANHEEAIDVEAGAKEMPEEAEAEAVAEDDQPRESPKPASPPKLARRSPLKQVAMRVNSPAVNRASPGPSNANGTPLKPGGIQWKTSRNDLSSVLAKFPGSKPSGMSRRLRIAPLHTKIGPPAKALPPVPQKPVRKKKGESEDEDEDEDEEGEEESDGEGGVRKKKGKSKEKGLEWFMVED